MRSAFPGFPRRGIRFRERTVTRSVTKLSQCLHKIGDDREVLHMSTFLIVILIGLVLLVAYHTGTYGRRGRRWGG